MQIAGPTELLRAGRYAEAEQLCRQLVAANASDAGACQLLGLALRATGRTQEALKWLARSVKLAPSLIEFRSNLAGVLADAGRMDEAIEHLRAIVAMSPDWAQGHHNLAVVLERSGRLEEALVAYDRAIALEPCAQAHTNRGNALSRLGQLSNAIESHRAAIELSPNCADAHNNLASCLAERGDLSGAIDQYRKAAELRPDHPAYHSNVVLMMHYDPRYSEQERFDEARRWARRHADPLTAASPSYDNHRDPDRRLRVGYISSNFNQHPVGQLIEPIITDHDRQQFEVVCYSNGQHADGLTRRIQEASDAWREVNAWSDERLVNQIRADRIDILVDLTGHLEGHRLRVLARRPAPIQVTYGGYYATTGVAAMDYRITDGVSEPVGLTDDFHVEELIRLPSVTWCYRPGDSAPPVGPLPARSCERITFCNLNSAAKTTEHAIALWSRILLAVPDSRLMMLSRDRDNAHWIERFSRRGIEPARVEFVLPRPRDEYLSLYNRADIALDPFPFNGDTTTCDAFWMGVPIVTLMGSSFVSRRGLCHCKALGLDDLIAYSPAHYERIALALAGDLDRLSALRDGLRARFASSPLANSGALTRELGKAYRSMWRRFTSRFG